MKVLKVEKGFIDLRDIDKIDFEQVKYLTGEYYLPYIMKPKGLIMNFSILKSYDDKRDKLIIADSERMGINSELDYLCSVISSSPIMLNKYYKDIIIETSKLLDRFSDERVIEKVCHIFYRSLSLCLRANEDLMSLEDYEDLSISLCGEKYNCIREVLSELQKVG